MKHHRTSSPLLYRGWALIRARRDGTGEYAICWRDGRKIAVVDNDGNFIEGWLDMPRGRCRATEAELFDVMQHNYRCTTRKSMRLATIAVKLPRLPR